MGWGYPFVQPMAVFIIFAIPVVNTEMIHFCLKQMQKRCKKCSKREEKKKNREVISHLAAGSPWNELDLTLKNNEI